MSKQAKGKELPANYMCPSNPNNMDCNACGGEVCGQKKIPQEEWIVKNWLERQEGGYREEINGKIEQVHKVCNNP